MAETMTIGELAAAAGVHVETIRYYEREGILPEPLRTPSGYRQYGEADRWRLAFIQRGKGLGFSLKDIAELLGAGEDRTVDEVLRIAAARLEHLDAELAALTRTREQLARLVDTCATGADADCLDLAPR
jgi:MerR family copper efflux transcriptional regulator